MRIVREENGAYVEQTKALYVNGRIYPFATLQRLMRESKLDELAALGLHVATDMEIPEGKVPTGDPRFELVEGSVKRVWDLIDAPGVDE